jgi:hypothetical protein
MGNKFTFVGMLYLVAAACLLIGIGDGWIGARLWMSGQDGKMTSTDPRIARAEKYAPGTNTQADVEFSTAAGAVKVPEFLVRAQYVKRLANGDSIPVRFIPDDPKSAYLDGEKPPSSLWALLVGILALPVAIYAHRQLRREMASSEDG